MHADDLSHALSSSLWAQIRSGETQHKPARLELPFVVLDTATGECFASTISFARPIIGHGAKGAPT